MNVETAAQMEEAREHLDKAVARLEAALQARAQADAEISAAADAEATALQADNQALRDINEKVAGRVDGAIARLRTILED